MKTNDFFQKELNVKLTLNELYDIASALATEHFEQYECKFYNNAKRAWQIREKICNYIDEYK